MGGKSLKNLMESGQVTKGARGMDKSKKVQDREMFQAANERLTSDVDTIIKNIKSMEPITAMKEANSVIGRKGKYKNLTPEESKKILQDTEDHIFERDIPETEDFAAGGVAGLLGERPRYQTGGDVAFDASDASVYGSSAISVTPETVADAFGNQVQQDMGNTYNPPLIEDVIEEKSVIEDTNKQGIMQNENIVGNPNGVGVNEPTPMPDRPITNLPPALEDRPITNLPGAGAATNLPGSGAPGTGNLMSGYQDFAKKTYGDGPMMSTADSREYTLPDGTTGRGSSTSIGRINAYLKSIGQPEVTYNNSGLGGLQTGLLQTVQPGPREGGKFGIYGQSPLAQAAMANGGRAGFAGGGMGRRGFLKLLGSLGAGAAGLKTGLMGLAKKSEPVVEVVKETAQEVPSYFFSLVNKIRSLGDDTLATQDKTISKKYKDYVMEEDFAGNIEIIKKGDDVAEDVFMSYKVDEVPLKKGGSRKVEEYEEYTARPDMEGKMKDIEPGVPDNVIEEAMSEAPSIRIKKASGGIARMLGE